MGFQREGKVVKGMGDGGSGGDRVGVRDGRFLAISAAVVVCLGVGVAFIGFGANEEVKPQGEHVARVATFADWPKAKIGDLPPGTMFTQDGDDLLQKLNGEFQVPALFTREGGVVGNGVAERISDPERVVGVVKRGGVQVWRKEGEEPVR